MYKFLKLKYKIIQGEMKMKKAISLLLIVTMCISMLAGCSGQTQGTGQAKETGNTEEKPETEVQAPDTGEASPAEAMLQEIEKTLMTQLQPLPEKGKNEKIGVLIISLTNPFWANMKTCYEQAGKDLGIQEKRRKYRGSITIRRQMQ